MKGKLDDLVAQLVEKLVAEKVKDIIKMFTK